MQYKFNFLLTGGVPLTNDLMSLIEEAYQIFEVIGDVAGNLTILSGCELVGSTVNPGILAIEGKLYYFEGGPAFSKVYIHKEDISKIFQDNTSKILINKRTVKFGNSSNSYNWDDFIRLDSLKVMKNKIDQAATQSQIGTINNRLDVLELKTAPIVNGGIVMIWRKPQSEIPLGWKPCLDIRGKTVFGYDPNDLTNTFNNLNSPVGSRNKYITKQNIPDYGINFFGATNSGQTAVGNDLSIIKPNGKNADGYYDHTYTINSGGSGQALDVLNPGLIVDFIEPNFQ